MVVTSINCKGSFEHWIALRREVEVSLDLSAGSSVLRLPSAIFMNDLASP